MKRNIRRIGPWVVVGVLAAGCGGSSGTDESAARAEASVADSAADMDSLAVASSADETAAGTAADTADPFAGFELDAGPTVSTDLRRLSLMLRNDAPTMAIVHADGGADEVLLDSVPAGSGRRVDLLTRASVVTLRAETPDRRALRTIEVAVGADTVVEVLVGAAGPP